MKYTRKDFRVEWYSGTGKGGQHRNKHQNCCRITHLETGLVAVGTESRSRVTNQRAAFRRLVNRMLQAQQKPKERRFSGKPIRHYHEPRNEVRDVASGLRLPYRQIINDLGPMIEARRKAKRDESAR